MSSASIEDLGRTAGSWLDQVSVTMGEVTVMMLVNDDDLDDDR